MPEFEGGLVDMTSQSEHLSPSDLAGFLDRDLDADRRQRVELHLDGCPECRRELAEVSRLAESTSGERVVARKRPVRRWLPLVLSGAVAASLVGVALVRRSGLATGTSLASPVRAPAISEGRARIGIVSPGENATTLPGSLAFTWRPLAADFYRLTLLTESGAPVWTVETADTTASLSDRVVLQPGALYFWRVDAISAGISASSGSHRFRVAP